MPSTTVNTKSSIMDVESSGSAAAAAPRLLSSFINLPVTTSSGRHVNNLFQHDEMLTNPPEEYKNEEDDPFSAVLREMKLKGEFPCRLCEAVFPNLRALKGKTITKKNLFLHFIFLKVIARYLISEVGGGRKCRLFIQM